MDNCWLLSAPRSGSWFLAKTLTGTGLFRNDFLEYISWEHDKKQPLPQICKVLRRPFLLHYNDKIDIPVSKFIWLKRDNNFERAISMYFSLITGIWQKEVFRLDYHRHIPFLPKLAMECLAEVSHSYGNDWSTFLESKDYLFVSYNDLMKEPQKQIERILNYLGLASPTFIKFPTTLPMKRAETDEYVERLKSLSQNEPLPQVYSFDTPRAWDKLILRYKGFL